MPDYSNYNARTYDKYGDVWRNTGKCVFCDLKQKYVITETDNMVLTVNIFPYVNGHLLIIPKRHVEAYADMNQNEVLELNDLANAGKNLISKIYKTDDVWFLYRTAKGFSGQKTVPHVHAHLIPFNKDLFSWKFQEITDAPEEFAKKCRKKL
ncbi:hypothetical protein CO178_00370 [candidate division WWE3 bacterium CG_4_9_14_3_um_filter_34_6]|uniref:HIT domain-containing protein n=1 Tax=candidate division WWE3 bacterium CG_4_9_14_3_um_filter_34_6 TaxID=1975079 RepID=A0A2M7X5A6_UNCKA|nr:MAG: hypothetical protein CO178_00370 [candidate division WWE3 bacterium CG_4_9_14_3_um_filter_34_6]